MGKKHVAEQDAERIPPARVDVEMVVLPGTDGELGVYPQHVPDSILDQADDIVLIDLTRKLRRRA